MRSRVSKPSVNQNVASMVGVDATESVVECGRRLCREEELDDRIRFVLADACQSGMPTSSADFVWGEDAWCYVVGKPRLIAEAARLVRPGGVIAFTDCVEGPEELSEAEAQRLLELRGSSLGIRETSVSRRTNGNLAGGRVHARIGDLEQQPPLRLSTCSQL